MSVYLKPCTGCPLRDGCEQRDDFRKRVRGLGLRSATFNCDRLKAAIAPGIGVLLRELYYGAYPHLRPQSAVSAGIVETCNIECVLRRVTILETRMDAVEGKR